MSVPKYNEMYMPFLKSLESGNALDMNSVRDFIKKDIQLSDSDASLLLPSGTQTYFYNRTGWCAMSLIKAGLVFRPQRGFVQITEEGKKHLSQGTVITNDVLKNYPTFADWLNPSKDTDNSHDSNYQVKDETPQEAMDRVFKELNSSLASDLLSEVLQMDPFRFERLVVELLVKMGYGKLQYDSHATRKTGDEGIDGIVTADKLGFDSIYIQAKRFKDNSVGRPELQKFVGALAGQGAQKGIYITTSKFSKEAISFAEKNLNYKLVLIDGLRLANLMIEYELGVSTEYRYSVKKLDTDYFTDD